ncbi:hypothetical protein [Streptomyces sp. NPDC088915]|uniref:hypothetical protein n=1 Tax=Streptomyces sp. NPDC088915 TaxID=3365912 RepID=UPI003812C2C8
MNLSVTDDALLDGVVQYLDELADRLQWADARRTAQILARVVSTEHGVIANFLGLVSAGSQASQDHAADGTFPAETWLAFGRAANTLSNLSADLEEYQEVFERVGKQPPAAPSAPPKATAFVARGRHR